MWRVDLARSTLRRVSQARSVLMEWRALIVKSQVSANARLVALVLSTHMDSNGGSCFPSITRMQRESDLGRSTVCRALTELERSGLIERARGGRGRPTRYRATSATAGLAVVPQRDSTSATVAPEDVQESVHNFSRRADARRKRKGARALKARPDLNYLDEADGGG
jgi:DNA-binding transcriptional regulator YhcF (GntR family)